MGKVKIEDLRYIVMEGAGARGNTYLGAVRGIEAEFKALEKSGVLTVAEIGARSPGVMDYNPAVQTDNDDIELPRIKGVAGSSAGAITTFALTLGLNSDEIEEVLEFDYTRFISEGHAARYRMIGEDSALYIGEDDKLTKKSKKSVGGKKIPFVYDLTKERTEVKGNGGKAVARSTTVNVLLKIFVDGLVSNGKQISYLFKKESNQNSKWNQFWNKFFDFFKKSQSLTVISRLLINWFTNIGLYFTGTKVTGINFDANSVASLVLDRGLFSAFQVREFFYDLLLFAAVRDTYFQRRLLLYFKEPKMVSYNIVTTEGKIKSKSKEISIVKDDLNRAIFKKFEIGDRTKLGLDANNADDNVAILFAHLQNMTFEEFEAITKVDSAVAVSNYTTSSSIYFSNTWTPKFRVLEAVAASMALPPAMRPVFNESDVFFKTQGKKAHDTVFPREDYVKKFGVKVNGIEEDFVDELGNFKQADYELYEFVVKKALQTDLMKGRSTGGTGEDTYIDMNNLIELNTSLPLLRDIVLGNYRDAGEDENGKPLPPVLVTLKTNKVEVNGDIYSVDDKLLAFYYNAQYKGLFIDGGYFNNIPYSYFRESHKNLDGLLAIKMDRNFPKDFMDSINQKYEAWLNNSEILVEEEIFEFLDLDSILGSELEPLKIITQTTEEVSTLVSKDKLKELIRREFQAYFNTQRDVIEREIQKARLADDNFTAREERRLRKKEYKADDKVVKKIFREWKKHYKRHNNVRPWAENKSILAIAFNGYAFGAERGQIKTITDHSHIIPLFDYGVGTYDFDLNSVRPLAKLSQDSAECAIREYFKI